MIRKWIPKYKEKFPDKAAIVANKSFTIKKNMKAFKLSSRNFETDFLGSWSGSWL